MEAQSLRMLQNARSQFEEHLRALRHRTPKILLRSLKRLQVRQREAKSLRLSRLLEAADNKSKSDYSASEAVAEDSLTVEELKTARTRAAVTEAQNAGLDDLAAAYAARLGITPRQR